MRRLAILGILAVVLSASPTAAAGDTAWRATLPGHPGAAGTVTVTISGSTGTLRWSLTGLSPRTMLTVDVRGGSCATPHGRVIMIHRIERFVGGRSARTYTLTADQIGWFLRNWRRWGAVELTATDAGRTECVAFHRLS